MDELEMIIAIGTFGASKNNSLAVGQPTCQDIEETSNTRTKIEEPHNRQILTRSEQFPLRKSQGYLVEWSFPTDPNAISIYCYR